VPPLATRSWGDGPLLVLLHGFTQNAGAWGPFGAALGRSRRILAIDLPGHGGSSAVAADLGRSAELVLETVGDEPIDLLGYSLGGRLALELALGAPHRVSRLVLLGATAGIDDPTEAAARRARDEALADQIERTDDVAAFLRQWLDQDLFADLSDDDAQLSARLRNTAPGLASSLRHAGAGTQVPSWDRLDGLGCPVLVVAGEEDDKFSQLGRRLVERLPDGRLALIRGASHACHLSHPLEVASAVDGWLG